MSPVPLDYTTVMEEGVSLLPPDVENSNGRYQYKSVEMEKSGDFVGSPGTMTVINEEDLEIRDLLTRLFEKEHWWSYYNSKSRVGSTTKSHPPYAPERRGRRHRDPRVYWLNEFRHWWKTSRLLVRLSGGYCMIQTPEVWSQMARLNVHKHKQMKAAYRAMKAIGRGGAERIFLKRVFRFTRTLRIVIAIARAWEARIDNRLYEVGMAEAFAFMGNRCSRQIARDTTDWATKRVAFPLIDYIHRSWFKWDSRARNVIIFMGFIRAILPFCLSFIGSRIGRDLTFATYKYANYRWMPVQSIMNFHEKAGAYQDTAMDPELANLAREVATFMGHGDDPEVTRAQLGILGFQIVATGSGGHAKYRRVTYHESEDYVGLIPDNSKKATVVTLNVTPYGPSISGEMPRFVVLERRVTFYAQRRYKKGLSMGEAKILDAAIPREAKVQGFTFSGAFFSFQEWAALKNRFDEELLNYSNACKKLGTKKKKDDIMTPPTDLASLKTFIRMGRPSRKQHKDDSKFAQIQKEVRKMAKQVATYQKQGKAPKRIILYLEGLDCAGKSSTGMLICQALEECGFGVRVAQHNLPPTPEQRTKPWMHRIRFEYPDDMYGPGEEVPEYSAAVWDRGPAGDFVYGGFDKLPLDEKMQKYEQFRTYDEACNRNEALFLKILFVSDRDAIAATLGKRLAQKHIVDDLHIWLDANSVEHERPGLEEIELHIDPTDFMAFNNLECNLSMFCEFARNTDEVGHVGSQKGEIVTYRNPWVVICTSDRHRARLGLLRAFQQQLKQYTEMPRERGEGDGGFQVGDFNIPDSDLWKSTTIRPVPNNIVEKKEHGISMRAVFQALLLGIILYLYAYQTWNFNFHGVT